MSEADRELGPLGHDEDDRRLVARQISDAPQDIEIRSVSVAGWTGSSRG